MSGLVIEGEVLIEAPVDVVWRTITEPDQMSQWFADRLDQATRAMAQLAAQWDRRLATIKRLAEAAHVEANKAKASAPDATPSFAASPARTTSSRVVTTRGRETMTDHKTGTREEWLAARLELLEAEKALTRRSDELARRRQELPWVRVEKDYRFTTEDGDASLRDLFGGRSQMLVYHFMFDPDWNEGCPSCSAVTDGFAGSVPHFEHHDVAFVVVSRAPLDKLVTYKRRMGWDFRWVSSFGSSFNYDFHGTVDPAVAPVEYNYKDQAQLEAKNVAWRDWSGEQPGMSAFARNGDDVFHTYSAYARGFDGLWPMWQWLDRAPLGRNEGDWSWFRRHDEYPATAGGPS